MKLSEVEITHWLGRQISLVTLGRVGLVCEQEYLHLVTPVCLLCGSTKRRGWEKVSCCLFVWVSMSLSTGSSWTESAAPFVYGLSLNVDDSVYRDSILEFPSWVDCWGLVTACLFLAHYKSQFHQGFLVLRTLTARSCRLLKI